MNKIDSADLVCLSHLRWRFVYQRPQHLISRFARSRRVFFVEEPLPAEGPPRLSVDRCEASGVWIVTPCLPVELTQPEVESAQRDMLAALMSDFRIAEYILWYYTPMALAFTSHLRPLQTVYDCMDELSNFQGAPAALRHREQLLFQRADIVFTGGRSLYEACSGSA